MTSMKYATARVARSAILLSTSFILLISKNKRFMLETPIETPFERSFALDVEKYVPAKWEKYVVENTLILTGDGRANPSGCTIWNSSITGGPSDDLNAYDSFLHHYNEAVQEFIAVPDILNSIFYEVKGGELTLNNDVCERLSLRSDGISAFFAETASIGREMQLPHPFLSYSSTFGHIEPLLPPLRSHKICTHGVRENLMRIDYLVHDFALMCRRLKPTSRRIFVDMGASLSFHGAEKSPVLDLLELYEKFGFHFDHIYGFERTVQDPALVYGELLPPKYFPQYHWINVGISSEKGSYLNPLSSIISQFTEDDFVVVKLDIDTSSIEVPLVYQLLESNNISKIIDQFYFEHHVHLGELAPYWKKSMEGTMELSLNLFQALREKGIASHYWP